MGVHRTTVGEVVTAVSDALARLLDHFVTFPTDGQIAKVKQKFFLLGDMPNTIGVIDCTHVHIQAPRQREWEYVNRKGRHSINVQLVGDADLAITSCVVRWPGSVHDAHIFRESRLFTEFQTNRPDGVILADSAYPLLPWVMTPFPTANTPSQMCYNNAHGRTRCRSAGLPNQRPDMLFQENGGAVSGSRTQQHGVWSAGCQRSTQAYHHPKRCHISRVQNASQQRPWEALTDERGQRRLLSLVLAKRSIQTMLLATMMRKEHGKLERFNMLSAENSRMMAQELSLSFLLRSLLPEIKGLALSTPLSPISECIPLSFQLHLPCSAFPSLRLHQ
ncbi:hypothetical protein JOQ06_023495, partial [Pogonophryne albipinna]